MRKFFFLSLVLLMLGLFPLLIAQEKSTKKENNASQELAPINDKLLIWMVGEWEGWFDGPLGKTKEWSSCKLVLDDQFLFVNSRSERPGMTHKGLAYLTVEPKSHEILGFWYDNFRAISQGKGRRENDKLYMKWSGAIGDSIRVTEKIDDNKFIITVKIIAPDGNIKVYKGEMTRIKK